MKTRRLVISVVASVLVGASVAGWFIIGGTYGAEAIFWGRNPLKLTPPAPGAIEESMLRGEQVAAAITTFHGEHGAYPRSLSELVPEYIVELPEPTVGYQRWEYATDSKKGYVLTFFIGPMYQKYWYEGTAADWFADL